MRIAISSKQFINNDTEANLNTMFDTMKAAKDLGAEVIVFGEAFLQGFEALKWNYDFDKGIALNIYSEPINRLCKTSRKLNLDVIFGYYEKDGTLISSSSLIIERGEPIYNYKRLTKSFNKPSNADRHYYEGQVVEVFEYRHMRCMIASGNDLLSLTDLYSRNEEILFCPTYEVINSQEEYVSYINKLKEASKKLEHTNVIVVNSKCQDKTLGGAWHLIDGELINKIDLIKDNIVLINIEEEGLKLKK